MYFIIGLFVGICAGLVYINVDKKNKKKILVYVRDELKKQGNSIGYDIDSEVDKF